MFKSLIAEMYDKGEVDEIVYQPTGLNESTGARADDDLASAVETVFQYTPQGHAITLHTDQIAERKLAGRQDTWTDQQIADADYEVRRALLTALKYDRGNGRRLEGTMIMCLNTDDGVHTTDDNYCAFLNLEGSIAGNMIGRYAMIRLHPIAVTTRGTHLNLGLRENGYLDNNTITERHIEGFVKGWKHLEDALGAYDELKLALAKIRNASRASAINEEREFIDRTAPRSVGF